VTNQDHRLGEVLLAAREAKGVDLARVERDTKIRERYLSALERGEYRELPGAVYTRGFLRNYGSYLGLDPDYLIDLYRLETSVNAAERPVAPTPPRPMSVRRRRTFVVTQGAVAAAILTIMVGALVAWLGYEFFNFARTPELQILQPVGDVAEHTGSTMTIRGTTAANATIVVEGLPENPSGTADAQGNFEMTLRLLPGSNEIRVHAVDPVTDRSSEKLIRRINVVSDAAASPTPVAVAMTLTQPEADAAITGAVPVAGTAGPAAQIVLSAVLVTPATPTFAVTDETGATVPIQPQAPTAPEPASVAADAAGAFSGSLALAPGTWDVVVTAPETEPITRRVAVRPAAGLSGTLTLDGGDSYLEVDQDGVPLDGVSGGISNDGDRIDLQAQSEMRIRAGNAGAVRLSINGISLGTMGGNGAVLEWRIASAGE